MKRYIDANVLKNYIWSLSTHALNEWDTIGVLDAVDKQPTEDVTPVVHAHWELEKIIKVNTIFALIATPDVQA